VDEGVASALVGLDEAVALVLVEELQFLWSFHFSF